MFFQTSCRGYESGVEYPLSIAHQARTEESSAAQAWSEGQDGENLSARTPILVAVPGPLQYGVEKSVEVQT